jgi:hypothetical protein
VRRLPSMPETSIALTIMRVEGNSRTCHLIHRRLKAVARSRCGPACPVPA